MNVGQSSNPECRPPADAWQQGDGRRATAQPALFARLPGLAQRWRDGAIDDACYAAMYFLYGQIATHGRRYASRRRKADPRPDAVHCVARLEHAAGAALRTALLDELARRHFLGVIPAVPAALCAWLRGRWALHVCEHVPSAVEVLRLQARGRRPVTLLADYPRLLQPVLKQPDAWTFMVHDLEHAYKFFADERLHAAQRAFFAALERALAQRRFEHPLRDAVFADKFDYLISDMNTHPQHGLHYLRAILIEYHLRRERRPPRAALSPAAQAELTAALAGLDAA